MAYGDLAYRLHPQRCALVVVDVQRDFFSPVTKQGVEREVADVPGLLGRISDLIIRARSAAVPVVYVQTIADEASDALAWRTRRGVEYPYEQEVCLAGTPGAEIACEPPTSDDLVVTKFRYDAFIGTKLDELLKDLGRESLLFTGTLTDICVETSLRHAVCLDYLVAVAADCCRSFAPEHHKAALARIERAFGPVTTSAEIASHWPSRIPTGAATSLVGEPLPAS